MFLSLIEKRRSLRKYQERPVEVEKIEALMEAALRAPSSRGLNPWEFILVTERAMLERLAAAKPHGASFLKGAPLGIVICADPAKSDVWVEDASIASIFIHVAATSMGLGSCWIQIRKRMHNEAVSAEAYVRQALAVPENLKVEAIIAVGYPDEEKPPHAKATLQYEKLHQGLYGKPWGVGAKGE